MNTLHQRIKKANLSRMKNIGLKLLSTLLLLVQLVSPAQAVVADMSDMNESPSEAHHCMQQMQQHADHDQHDSKSCCEQNKVCDEGSCQQCQACAAMVMLINLHRHSGTPNLSATSLIHVAEYLEGIHAQNLYRPPIDLL